MRSPPYLPALQKGQEEGQEYWHSSQANQGFQHPGAVFSIVRFVSGKVSGRVKPSIGQKDGVIQKVD